MAVTNQNRIIRKIIVAFGNLFNNITLVRYNENQTEQERFLVPLTYAPKELYVQRLEADPDLTKKVQMTLPRMSYEMMGMSYDSSRKQNTNVKNFAQSNTLLSQYNPVPYNFDFTLEIYTRNHEDVHSIVETIIPFFTPDYTLNVNLIPEMGITKEIPIILNSTDREVRYEGDSQSDPRMIIWTLNFTVKGFIFGAVSDASRGLITHSITRIFDDITPEDTINFHLEHDGTGTYQINEYVYQGFTIGTATATAKVVGWDTTNNILSLVALDGNFITSLPIVGASSHASYLFTSYEPSKQKLVQIDITPNPSNANSASNWTANTVITEYT